MKRVIIVVLLVAAALTGGFIGSRITVQAQTAAPAVVTVSGSHTSCPVSLASQMVICGAGDGLWLSINAGALVQVATGTQVTGVTSISVNGGTAQTGPVALTIPTKATTIATTTIQ